MHLLHEHLVQWQMRERLDQANAGRQARELTLARRAARRADRGKRVAEPHPEAGLCW